jgi:hypothetical protein
LLESSSHKLLKNKEELEQDSFMDELDLEGFSLGEEPVENFLRFNSICGGNKGKKVSHIIWFAVVWTLVHLVRAKQHPL